MTFQARKASNARIFDGSTWPSALPVAIGAEYARPSMVHDSQIADAGVKQGPPPSAAMMSAFYGGSASGGLGRLRAYLGS